MIPNLNSWWRACALGVLGSAVVFGVGCGGDDDGGGGDRLRVVATTAIVEALAREVGGDHIDLEVLAGTGIDPHDYDPTADDLRKVGDADLVLRNGLTIDEFLDDAIQSAGGDAEVVTVTEGIDPVALEEDGDAHDHEGEDGEEHEDEDAEEHEEEDGDSDDHDHDHGEGDPHVWHNPLNVQLMVLNIAEALAEADPENAAAYESNAEVYNARLSELDAEIAALIEEIPAENRKIVTNHEAITHFIARYDLEFVGAVIPSTTTGAEPSAQDIARLADLIEEEGVKAIFAESSLDPRVAEQLAQDTGVVVVDDLYADTLGEPGSGAETVDGMLLANARKISEALK